MHPKDCTTLQVYCMDLEQLEVTTQLINGCQIKRAAGTAYLHTTYITIIVRLNCCQIAAPCIFCCGLDSFSND